MIARMTSRLLLCCLVFAVGCGRNASPSLAHVHGRVYFRGQPLGGGTIVFTPDTDRGGRGPLASARIDADGNYQLTTDDRTGATPGWHRITIAGLGDDQLPPRYRDPELSEQRYEVRTDRVNRCDLHLD